MIFKILVAIPVGVTAAVAAVTVLPIFGAVGTITATGMVVASAVGGLAGAVDTVVDEIRNH